MTAFDRAINEHEGIITRSVITYCDFPGYSVERAVTEERKIVLTIIDEEGRKTVINSDCPQILITDVNPLFNAMLNLQEPSQFEPPDLALWGAYHCKLHGISNDNILFQVVDLEQKPAQFTPDDIGVTDAFSPGGNMRVIVEPDYSLKDFFSYPYFSQPYAIVVDPEAVTVYEGAMTGCRYSRDTANLQETICGITAQRSSWCILNYIGKDDSGATYYDIVTDGYITFGDKLFKSEM